MILVRSCPARPTNGSPCASSSAPGASPTNISSACGFPDAKDDLSAALARCGHFTQVKRRLAQRVECHFRRRFLALRPEAPSSARADGVRGSLQLVERGARSRGIRTESFPNLSQNGQGSTDCLLEGLVHRQSFADLPSCTQGFSGEQPKILSLRGFFRARPIRSRPLRWSTRVRQ